LVNKNSPWYKETEPEKVEPLPQEQEAIFTFEFNNIDDLTKFLDFSGELRSLVENGELSKLEQEIKEAANRPLVYWCLNYDPKFDKVEIIYDDLIEDWVRVHSSKRLNFLEFSLKRDFTYPTE
jgi:hypothetical protein